MPNNEDDLNIFPLIKKEQKDLHALKWKMTTSNYEIHIGQLDSFNTGDVVEHSTNFIHAVKQTVTTIAHVGPSLFKTYSRTLSKPLDSIWKSVLQDVLHTGRPQNTEEDFEYFLKAFVAVHTSPEDRYEALQQLRLYRKPPTLMVQSFYYRIREVNEMISWMPGTEPALDDRQIRQVFHDGMPQAWKSRFADAGKSTSVSQLADLLKYFRTQERQQAIKAHENTVKQSLTKQNGQSSRSSHGARRDHYSRKRKGSLGGKDQSKAPSTRISDDADCPIHPGKGHKWGECRSNAYSQNKKNKGENKTAAPGAKTNNNKKSVSFAASVTKKTPQEEQMSEDEKSFSSVINNSPVDNNCKLNDNCQTMSETFNESFAHFIDVLNPFSPEEKVSHSSIDELADHYTIEMNCFYLEGINNIEAESINLETLVSLQLRPTTLALVKNIQGCPTAKPLKVLFDTGSDKTLMSEKALPKGCVPKITTPLILSGLGQIESKRQVVLEKMRLPEFSPTQCVDKSIKAYVTKDLGPYDLIIGTDVMIPLGIDQHCSTKTVSWLGKHIPWKPADHSDDIDGSIEQLCISSCLSEDNEVFSHENQNICEVYKIQHNNDVQIKESKYVLISPEEVASQQQHLTYEQRKQLTELLSQFEPLFNGNLVRTGKLPKFKHKIHLELLPGSQPFYCRPYPVPERHKVVFRAELDRLVQIGILERIGPSEWLSPTFIIPKKDGRVRWISDFRALNKCIKRKVYPIPRIQDILQRRSGYKFFTKLDISMQFYTFELDEESKDLCAICTPFGNFRYNRLPMGVKQSPDIAQQAMESVLRDIDEAEVYIDDVGLFSTSWEEHLQVLSRVLKILQRENFTVNPLKCEWGVQETDWLGYWLTPTGLKPWKKKIDAILKIQPPTTIPELRSFIGAVTFYRDMFPQRSHILSPLTAQVGKKKLIWTTECQQAFDEAKAMLAKNVFLQYPDHNQSFHVYCDASDRQLGAVIMQNDKPVAYYSRKLNAAQQNYTVGEKEILSIVETLKEYHSMLYGCKELHVHTDHKNLIYNKFSSQRVIRWRMFLEDYAPIFHYIKGTENSLADGLSRLPITERQNTGFKNPIDQYRVLESAPAVSQSTSNESHLSFKNEYYSMATDEPDLRDCFVHLPVQQGNPFVADYENIARAQDRDADLQALARQHPEHYVQHLLAPDVNVWCYIREPQVPWKIYLPIELVEPMVRWYHLALGHIGTTRLFDTMSMHFHNANLNKTIKEIVTSCDTCQRMKNVNKGYGHLAPRETLLLPWEQIAVDLIGPWEIEIDNQKISFSALTIIDLVTNLTEIVRIRNKSSAHIAQLVEQTWLARYPMPQHIIYDQGTEFTGYHFQQMCDRNHILKHPISTKNPQANAVCERMHQTVGNALRTLQTLNPPHGVNDAMELINVAIAEAMFAHRSSFSEALSSTPGAIAFHRDMVLNIPVMADLITIRDKRQQLIDDRLIKANRHRFAYDYAVGQQVLKLVYKPSKLQPRAEGPYEITRVHTNGTITIRLTPYVIERINIRRVKPYRQ